MDGWLAGQIDNIFLKKKRPTKYYSRYLALVQVCIPESHCLMGCRSDTPEQAHSDRPVAAVLLDTDNLKKNKSSHDEGNKIPELNTKLFHSCQPAACIKESGRYLRDRLLADTEHDPTSQRRCEDTDWHSFRGRYVPCLRSAHLRQRGEILYNLHE